MTRKGCEETSFQALRIAVLAVSDSRTPGERHLRRTLQERLKSAGHELADRDQTPEALHPLLDREIPGLGGLFRHYSLEEIGTSTVQSRAYAGVANATLIFALPGSAAACRTA